MADQKELVKLLAQNEREINSLKKETQYKEKAMVKWRHC